MKIAHIFWSFTIGGAETMLVDIMNQQASEGNNVILLVINKHYSRELLTNLNTKVDVILLNRNPGSKNPYYFLKLNLLLLFLSPEIIHCHNYSLEQILLPRFLKKSILTVHGFKRPIPANTKFCHIVAISKAIQDDLIQKGISKHSVIYNGVKTKMIEKKKQFNSQIQIVCVGRLEHQIKGQDFLIKAFAHLKREIKNVKLHFIGEGSSKEYLKMLIKEAELEEDVIFHGLKSRKELYQILKDFDLLVQPSVHEGFGLIVVEGMIARIPIIISNASGLLEVTNNGKFAQHVVTNNDPEVFCKALVNTIKEIQLMDKSFEIKLDSAEKFVVSHFSIQETFANYQKIYKRFKV